MKVTFTYAELPLFYIIQSDAPSIALVCQVVSVSRQKLPRIDAAYLTAAHAVLLRIKPKLHDYYVAIQYMNPTIVWPTHTFPRTSCTKAD